MVLSKKFKDITPTRLNTIQSTMPDKAKEPKGTNPKEPIRTLMKINGALKTVRSHKKPKRNPKEWTIRNCKEP